MKAWCSFLLIIVLAATLRFYNLEKRFVFTLDEEYQATLAQTIVKDFHVIWIGVSVANLGFYLGPGWTYFTAFWHYLSHGDPVITAYIASGIGVITTALVYTVGTSLWNRRVGIVAGLLYATLPLIVFYDQKYLNLTLTPFLSLIVLWSLSNGWWWLFGLAFGLVFHTHMSLFPAIVPAIYVFYLKKKQINWFSLGLGVVLFVLTISPMIIFDFLHRFSNISTPLRWSEITQNPSTRVDPLLKTKATLATFSRLVYLAPGREMADETLFACSPIPIHASESLDKSSTWTRPNKVVSIAIFIILGIFLFRTKVRLLSLQILSIIISYLLIPSNAFEYYLLPIFPLLTFIPGMLKSKYTKLVCVILATLGIFTVITAKDSFGLETKKQLIRKITVVLENKPFGLEEKGGCHRWSGWRYLFLIYGRSPEISSTDQYLSWLYQIGKSKPEYIVRIIESRQVPNFDTNKSVKIEEGGFTAYVDRY